MFNRVLQTKIQGIALAIVAGVLAGVLVGAIAGCVYGHAVAQSRIELELIAYMKERAANHRTFIGQLPTKISGHIESECRAAGLSLGIPIGATVGLLSGFAGWAAYLILWKPRSKVERHA